MASCVAIGPGAHGPRTTLADKHKHDPVLHRNSESELEDVVDPRSSSETTDEDDEDEEGDSYYDTDEDDDDLRLDFSGPFSPLPGTRPDPEDPAYGLPDPGPGMAYSGFPLHPSHLADPSYYDTLGRDPMTQMRVYGLADPQERIFYVLQVLEMFPHKGLEILFDAATRGAADVVGALLAAGVAPHPEPGSEEEEDLLVPLHAAAYDGHLDCVRVLVEEGGVDPDVVSDGHTVLMRAVMSGHADIARWLLSTGRVDPHREVEQVDDDEDGPGQAGAAPVRLRALDVAALEGHAECVELLVDAMVGHKFSINDVMTLETMRNAGASESEDLMFKLVSWGQLPVPTSKVTKGDLNGEQRHKLVAYVTSAAELGFASQVLPFLAYLQRGGSSRGDDPAFRFSNGMLKALREGLVRAACNNDLESFDFFMDASLPSGTAGAKLVTGTLSQALFGAADENALDMVRYLVEKHGVNVNDGTHNPHDLTPLITAAGRGHLDVVEYLVDEAGADIRIGAGRENDTPLWFAVKGRHHDVALFLLRRGGPVNDIVPGQRRRPDFRDPENIFMRLIRFLDGDHGVKIFLDRDAAEEFAREAARGSVDIEGLEASDEHWWDKLSVIDA
ncbi:ankyrin repeat-containing domain protein [Xylariales sp. PMI_506]|nr:ankyrin repeat-containing domain protein [Xylariales sp. PMI_506]